INFDSLARPILRLERRTLRKRAYTLRLARRNPSPRFDDPLKWDIPVLRMQPAGDSSEGKTDTVIGVMPSSHHKFTFSTGNKAKGKTKNARKGDGSDDTGKADLE